jgi:hypothetical protein
MLLPFSAPDERRWVECVPARKKGLGLWHGVATRFVW